MSTPNDPLEDELREMRPLAPAPRLADAIASALDAPAAPPAQAASTLRRSTVLPGWLPWGLAAGLAAVLLVREGQSRLPATVANPPAENPVSFPAPVEPSASTPFTPVSSTNVLVGARDEGIVMDSDGLPMRRIRYQFVDTVNLRTRDESPAAVGVSFPREEIRLVPIQAL